MIERALPGRSKEKKLNAFRAAKTVVVLCLAVTITPIEAADIFVFSGKSEVTGGITMAAPHAGEIGSFNTSGEFTLTAADGSQTPARNSCTAMTNHPGSMYAMSGFCEVADAEEHSYGIAFNCDYRKGDPANNVCVGSLYGKTGKYLDRSGVASWTNVHGEIVGTGQWN